MSFESVEDIQDMFMDWFYQADVDGNGSLSFEEVSLMLQKAGYTYTEDELMKYFTSLDKNGDDSVSLDEFLQMMTGMPLVDHRRAVWWKAFSAWDSDQTGDINRDELKRVFIDVTGRELDQTQIEDAFRQLDLDGDGRITWPELAHYLASLTKKTL